MTDLNPTETPWLVIAICVLNGTYDRSEPQTLKAIEIGLRSIHHPDCVRATVRVRELMKKPAKAQ